MQICDIIMMPLYVSQAFTTNAFEGLLVSTILLINHLLGLHISEELATDISNIISMIFGLNAEPVSLNEFLMDKLL